MLKQVITFKIEGMKCAGCSNHLEKELNNFNGVIKATVNLATEKSTVEFDAEKITTEDLILKIVDSGFKGIVLSDNKKKKSEDKNDNKDLKRLIWSVLFSAPLLLNMILELFFGHGKVPILGNGFVQMILATPVQFIIGAPFYQDAFKMFKAKSTNMNTLIAIGTSAAYFYSVYNLFVVSHSLSYYFETSAILITFIILGKLLEQTAKRKTTMAITKLLNLQPNTAMVIRDDTEIEIPIELIGNGEIIVIYPGTKIPVDGKVIEGFTTINESMLTGESMPVEKSKNDLVYSGTLNNTGNIKIKAEKIGKDTLLAQIVKSVETAQNDKAPIQRFADKISSIFVPTVLVIAGLTFLGWFVASDFNVEKSLMNMIAVLVIACPCALGLATPTAIMVGTGKGAEYGILYKNGEVLENLQKIQAMVFDKTGTITKGIPEVKKVVAIQTFSETDILSYAMSLEQKSEHPLAKAIVEYGRGNNIEIKAVTAFESFSGLGLKGVVDNKDILIGTKVLLKNFDIDINEYKKIIEDLELEAYTVVLIAEHKKLVGLIALSDTIKEEAVKIVTALKKLNIETWLLTGDNKNAAQAVARAVGIQRVMSEVLPSDKMTVIEEIKEHKFVGMVGDGINDAPALVKADIGIAMGNGTDIAIESADITLLNGNLNNIIIAMSLSKTTFGVIKRNLFFALVYNIIGIPIAALGFLSPMIAGTAMALSSISVLLSSLALNKKEFKVN